jgi:hypothetical protein
MVHGFGCPVPDCTRVRMDATKKLTKVQRKTKSFREGRRIEGMQKKREQKNTI